MHNSADTDDGGSDAYIKPAKKTKPAAHWQASMTNFFGKKPAAASSCKPAAGAAAKPASKATTASVRKASGST